jgi:hypothetical protein
MSPTSYQTAPPRDDMNVSDDVSEFLTVSSSTRFSLMCMRRNMSLLTREVSLHAPPRDDMNVFKSICLNRTFINISCFLV